MEALDSKVPARDRSSQASMSTRNEEESGSERSLCCRRCGSSVTRDDERIAISDSHEHIFVNPAGHVFRLGCFRSAPGIRPLGEPTSFFSWFPGYAWRVALCGDCHEHLGWAYGAPVDFFGLILDRLVECDF